MRIILQPYQSIKAASAVVNLPQHVLRRGCRSGKVPHIRHNGRIYIDMVALLDDLDADNSGKPFGAEGR